MGDNKRKIKVKNFGFVQTTLDKHLVKVGKEEEEDDIEAQLMAEINDEEEILKDLEGSEDEEQTKKVKEQHEETMNEEKKEEQTFITQDDKGVTQDTLQKLIWTMPNL